MSSRAHPGHRVPWLCLAAGASILGGVAGLWYAAIASERAALDRLQQQLAQHAGAYLGVVTPTAPAGGYDPARLLSGANALAGATFWPGGLQLVLGTTALIPDDIGLLPLPDSAQLAIDRGAPVLTVTHAEERAMLVTFLGPQSQYLGWVGTWGAVGPRIPSPLALVLTVLAVAATALAVWASGWSGPIRQRALAVGTVVLAVLLLAAELNSTVRATQRAGIQTRLETVRHLIELAATAERVRQAELPAIAVDIALAARRRTPIADSGVVWSDSVASISAATPRTQGSLQLAVPLLTPGIDPTPAQLVWLLIPALGAAILFLGRSRPRP